MKKVSRKPRILVDGLEFPDFSKIKSGEKDYKINLIRAMNYANYVYDDKQLADFAFQYAKNISLGVANVPDYELRAAGIRAWLLKNDADIPEKTVTGLYEQLKQLAAVYAKTVDITTVKNDNNDKRTESVISQIEGVIDDVMSGKTEGLTAPYDICKNVGKFSIETVKSYFQKQVDEVKNTEYYSNEKYRKSCEIILKSILLDLDKFANVTKVTRTIRKPKKKNINPTKMVKKLNYLKDFEKYKSVSPEQIIGKNVLWVYNAKTRVLGCYLSESGFTVKGSTVYNYDTEKSVCKKLRKPDEVLKRLMECGKIEQRKILSEVKAVENKLNGRINADTLLMRVFS